jgi:hypothetical protein
MSCLIVEEGLRDLHIGRARVIQQQDHSDTLAEAVVGNVRGRADTGGTCHLLQPIVGAVNRRAALATPLVARDVANGIVPVRVGTNIADRPLRFILLPLS